MASQVTHLPHVKNVSAGRNHWDPMYNAIFEVYFTIPEAIGANGEDAVLLTEQVTKVSGLDALQKMPAANSQKFFGVDVSFLEPVPNETFAEITIEFNLNLRQATDAYTFKIFKKWAALGYSMTTGYRTLKADYVADNLRIAEGTRDGRIWRAYKFHDIFVTEVSGLDDLDYTSKDARKLTVKFRADYWEEEIA